MKNNIVLFCPLILILAYLHFAMAVSEPAVEWNRTFGGSAGGDLAYSVQQTLDGGYIIAGNTNSFGAGGMDVYLIKTDSEGNMIWDKTFGGSSDDSALFSVQQTIDGGYIVAGVTNSFGAGNGDGWLIKTDSNGNEEWNRTFGSIGTDLVYSAQETIDRGYIMAGWINLFGIRNNDIWLIKTDSNGIEEWNRTFGGAGDEVAESIHQISDGGYILAGGTNSFGAGDLDVYLIKTDSEGNMIWDKTFGGGGYDIAYSIQQTDDGGYILAGGTNSFGAGSIDIYLIKTDSNGNEEWNKVLGGVDIDVAVSIIETLDRGYIIAGYTNSFGAGLNDIWLIKLVGLLDSDNDGVVDDEDLCPDTPLNTEVDTNGCSATQFCDLFNPLDGKNDPNRKACIVADWKKNEKGKNKPNDCYIEKNKKNNWYDDVCMATPFAN